MDDFTIAHSIGFQLVFQGFLLLSSLIFLLVVKEGDVVPHNYPPGSHYLKYDSIYVYMMSLSKQCYDVYDQMVKQLRTDGGAYTPRPTNIMGNISGGVWGCFRVSAITEKGIYVGH